MHDLLSYPLKKCYKRGFRYDPLKTKWANLGVSYFYFCGRSYNSYGFPQLNTQQ